MSGDRDKEKTCSVCKETIDLEGITTEVRYLGSGTPVCSDRCEEQLLTAELPRGKWR